MTRALLALTLVCFGSLAQAHPLAPAMLELRETAADEYSVLWRTSTTRAGNDLVHPELPANCVNRGAAESGLEDEAWVSRWAVRCAGGLNGRSLGVSGLDRSRITVFLRLHPLQGEPTQVLLDAREPQYQVSAPQAAPAVFPEYLGLGIEHLLLGFDHVLFVVGLVLIVRRFRPLLITVTAFTAGHSLTLALATLGFIHVRQSYTEVGIALSILLLAVEAASPATKENSISFRKWPWAIAGIFGLLHGLGFAGALAEVGLPQQEIPLALFAFNLGIEAGQLLVVAALLALAAAWRSMPRQLVVPAGAAASLLPAYLMGSLAAYWLLQRLTVALT